MLTSNVNEVVPVMDHSEASHRKANPKRDKVEQTLSQIRALHELLEFTVVCLSSEQPQINSPADAANLSLPSSAIWIMKSYGVVILTHAIGSRVGHSLQRQRQFESGACG